MRDQSSSCKTPYHPHLPIVTWLLFKSQLIHRIDVRCGNLRYSCNKLLQSWVIPCVLIGASDYGIGNITMLLETKGTSIEGTSQFFLIVSAISFAKVSLSVESTSLSEYTRVASCSHSLISSDVCFIASPVVNSIPWRNDIFTFRYIVLILTFSEIKSFR